MRPQFSLLALLFLMAYAAVLASAAADIFSDWTRIAIYALPVFFVVACVMAIFARGSRRVFACGMIVGCVLYAIFAIVSLPVADFTPHYWIMTCLPEPPESLEFHEDYDLYSMNLFLAQFVFTVSQCTLAAGVISGFVAIPIWGCWVDFLPEFIPGSAVREERRALQEYVPRSWGAEPGARSIRNY